MRLGQIQHTGFALIGQLRNIFITSWIAIEVVNGNFDSWHDDEYFGHHWPSEWASLSTYSDFCSNIKMLELVSKRSEEVHLCANEDNEHQKSLSSEVPQDIET